MTHLDAMVQALLEEPGDHALRRVFRDWLSEQDDPALRARGELLAVQDELTAWVPDLEQRLALQRREQELIGTYRAHWLGPLAAYEHRFEQGVVHLTLSVEQFLEPDFAAHAVALFRQGWIRTVHLTGLEAADLSALVMADHLGAVVGLDLKGATHCYNSAQCLAISLNLQRLKELDLTGHGIRTGCLRAISHATWAGQLTSLILRDNNIEDDDFDTLIPSFPRLRVLELDGNPLADTFRQRWLAWSQSQNSQSNRLVNSVGMTFALIPSGTFLMGSPEDEPERKTELNDEGPQHPVTISRPFYFGIYPITQCEFEAVMGFNPSAFTADNDGGPNHPVETITCELACEFCRRLSSQPEEVSAGRSYRLPSEAEWEHACRAGTTTPFWWGDRARSIDANFDGNKPYNGAMIGPFLGRTTPVGCYRANPFGLFDMHGNVSEWCADWYDVTYYKSSPLVDPPGSSIDGRHSARGGSWAEHGHGCRSAHRDFWYGDGYQSIRNGFRVVLTLPAHDITGGLPASAAPPPG